MALHIFWVKIILDVRVYAVVFSSVAAITSTALSVALPERVAAPTTAQESDDIRQGQLLLVP